MEFVNRVKTTMVTVITALLRKAWKKFVILMALAKFSQWIMVGRANSDLAVS